jgi:2-polyprenyl-3-methyl-5-hydroxy-6-metoxy-1,4-benzoquinol methylase
MGLWGFLSRQAERTERECRDAELSLLEYNPDAKVLDIGCGDGEFTMRVAWRIGVERIWGIDASPSNVEKAKKQGVTAQFYDLDKEDLLDLRMENHMRYAPYPIGTMGWDVIIVSHILEHVSNTGDFIFDIGCLLSYGGYAIIATPNLASWQHIFYLLCGKQPTIAEVDDCRLFGTWSPRGSYTRDVGMGIKGCLQKTHYASW